MEGDVLGDFRFVGGLREAGRIVVLVENGDVDLSAEGEERKVAVNGCGFTELNLKCNGLHEGRASDQQFADRSEIAICDTSNDV